MKKEKYSDQHSNEIFDALWPTYAKHMRSIVRPRTPQMSQEELDDALLDAAKKLSWFNLSCEDDLNFLRETIAEMEEAFTSMIERTADAYGLPPLHPSSSSVK